MSNKSCYIFHINQLDAIDKIYTMQILCRSNNYTFLNEAIFDSMKKPLLCMHSVLYILFTRSCVPKIHNQGWGGGVSSVFSPKPFRATPFRAATGAHQWGHL